MNLNIKEFSKVLNYLLDNNLKLQKEGKPKITIGACGEAGIGKTSVVQQIAEERGAKFVKILLSQCEELGDLVGYPVKEFEICDPDGKSVWVNEKLLSEYFTLGYHLCGETKSRMSYAIPSWVPQDAEEEVILFLDDYTRADPRMLQACMQLMEEGKYISWELPKKAHIILTTNPDTGEYSVQSLDTAQKTRSINFNLEADVKVWAEWAEKKGIDGRCINFTLLYANELFGKSKDNVQLINPRSLVMFYNAISGLDDFSSVKNLAMINTIAEGCFLTQENTVGNLFCLFIQNKLDKLIPPEELLLHDWKSVYPRLLHCCYNEDENYRADVASVLTQRFLNYVDYYIANEKSVDSQIIINRIVDFLNSKKPVLSEDLILVLCSKLISKHISRFRKMLEIPEIRNKLTSVIND